MLNANAQLSLPIKSRKDLLSRTTRRRCAGNWIGDALQLKDTAQICQWGTNQNIKELNPGYGKGILLGKTTELLMTLDMCTQFNSIQSLYTHTHKKICQAQVAATETQPVCRFHAEDI